ncbi:hypothetical protein IFM12275_59160 [Nocardia sputorum]|uniref:hypothetical protein n=1 Tax=Nocardia sputorum TaxID=2984338 RepID=UPI00249007AD|nr:hypothetical protein [Nocardia sputorum]BDT95940.1 hypothetical protein IFM12275_59160 [Nocardia sputorum]
MSAAKKAADQQPNEAERLAEYVAEIVASAPPISSDARARLAAVLGGSADRRVA